MSESISSNQSIHSDEATITADQHQSTEGFVGSSLSSHPDMTTPDTENTPLASTEMTGDQEAAIGLSEEDKHRLAKAIGYLVGRKPTYHRKITKRAFGSQNIDADTRHGFISQLDALTDAGVLDRKHQRYSIRPDANLISVDLDSIFNSSNDDTHQSL